MIMLKKLILKKKYFFLIRLIMKFKILTLFPEMFPGPLAHSISGKALIKKVI